MRRETVDPTAGTAIEFELAVEGLSTELAPVIGALAARGRCSPQAAVSAFLALGGEILGHPVTPRR